MSLRSELRSAYACGRIDELLEREAPSVAETDRPMGGLELLKRAARAAQARSKVAPFDPRAPRRPTPQARA
ncbi:hypothetical protein [Methylopila turkensis]|uniref:Uncharacterized protein n=1 Tax=Methylopila turkensis TaxID=1437816 RepID=A0A9W6JMN1_9HYPH|nr:hypothetical protein [Methylopila turkensis]GLK78635.1 hypothetical protein GCM10008174_03760 [Methylopila turkensis]